MPMAKFCQRGGKALPMGRQNLTNKEARKKTLFLWQKETSPYIRFPRKKESHKYVFMKKKKLLKQLIVNFQHHFRQKFIRVHWYCPQTVER